MSWGLPSGTGAIAGPSEPSPRISYPRKAPPTATRPRGGHSPSSTAAEDVRRHVETTSSSKAHAEGHGGRRTLTCAAAPSGTGPGSSRKAPCTEAAPETSHVEPRRSENPKVSSMAPGRARTAPTTRRDAATALARAFGRWTKREGEGGGEEPRGGTAGGRWRSFMFDSQSVEGTSNIQSNQKV